MSVDDLLTVRGTVVDTLPNAMFEVELPAGVTVLAYTAGKLRRRRIRILLGDEVDVEISAHDLTRGRIVWRHLARR